MARIFYSTEYQLEAVKVFVEFGSSYKHALETMAQRHPDQRVPTKPTLKEWIKKYQAVGARRTVIVGDHNLMWAEVELAALERLLNEIKSGTLPTNMLPAMAGIAADKRLRNKELDKGKTQNIKIHQLIEERRSMIISEAREKFDEPTPLLDAPEDIVVDLDKATNKWTVSDETPSNIEKYRASRS